MAKTKVYLKQNDGHGKILTTRKSVLRIPGGDHPPGGYIIDARKTDLVSRWFGDERWISFREGNPQAVEGEGAPHCCLSSEKVFHLSGSMLPDIIRGGTSARGAVGKVNWKVIAFVVVAIIGAGLLAWKFWPHPAA